MKRLIASKVCFLACLAVFALSACGNLATTGSTPQEKATIAGLESGLTAADLLALNYTSLPACPGPMLCADPTIKASIKAKAQAAYNLITAARDQAAAGVAVDMTAATAALTAYQAVVTTLPKAN